MFAGLMTWYENNRHYSLFFSIIILILVPPFLYENDFLSSLIYVFVSFVLINCLLILFGHPTNRIRGIIFGIIIIGVIWINFFIEDDYLVLKLVSNGLLTLMFGLTFGKLVQEIFKLEKISGQVVIGAIAAYLLLGLMGAFLFDVIEIIYPNSFNTDGLYSGFYSEIYLSFITISTLGYGDITPVTPQGQAAAIFVSISGQLYLTILMAMLVGKFLKDTDW